MLTIIILTNYTVYFEQQLDSSVFTAYQYHFLFFFFLLQAALSVAVSWSAILSKSASSSLCSLSLQASFSCSPSGITSHSFGSSPGSGHGFTTGSTSSSPSPEIGEKTLSLSTRSRLMSKLHNSTSANRRVSGVTFTPETASSWKDDLPVEHWQRQRQWWRTRHGVSPFPKLWPS